MRKEELNSQCEKWLVADNCGVYVRQSARVATRVVRAAAMPARLAFEFVNVLCVLVIDAFALTVLPLTTRVTLYAQIAVHCQVGRSTTGLGIWSCGAS